MKYEINFEMKMLDQCDSCQLKGRCFNEKYTKHQVKISLTATLESYQLRNTAEHL